MTMRTWPALLAALAIGCDRPAADNPAPPAASAEQPPARAARATAVRIGALDLTIHPAETPDGALALRVLVPGGSEQMTISGWRGGPDRRESSVASATWDAQDSAFALTLPAGEGRCWLEVIGADGTRHVGAFGP